MDYKNNSNTGFIIVADCMLLSVEYIGNVHLFFNKQFYSTSTPETFGMPLPSSSFLSFLHAPHSPCRVTSSNISAMMVTHAEKCFAHRNLLAHTVVHMLSYILRWRASLYQRARLSLELLRPPRI